MGGDELKLVVGSGENPLVLCCVMCEILFRHLAQGGCCLHSSYVPGELICTFQRSPCNPFLGDRTRSSHFET